jgi:hypothetical protein
MSRLDANGGPLGAPATVLTWSGSDFQPPTRVAAGKDTLLFFPDYRAARVDDNGALSIPPFAFRKLPPMTQMSTLELGPDVLVLSYESYNGGGVGLTRFRR